MIGFAQIAGGMPSSTSDMTRHLLTQTLPAEEARLAAYYERGMIQDNTMLSWANLVSEGRVYFSEAVDQLMRDYIKSGGDLDLIDAAQERIGKRLSDLAYRVQEGLEDAPLAVVRQDTHPMVLAGLGIETDGLLSKSEINALLAGRRADGELIEGKHYVGERHLPVNPKTGEERISLPIGSYDFCPTPGKSVAAAWGLASPAERASILNAHLDAARAAVSYIATEVGQVRLGDGGKDGSVPGHVTWLEFTHHTARRVQITQGNVTHDLGPGDPNPHTHFLIPNVVYAEDGKKVGSLDTAAIRGFIFEADGYYQARLAQNLRDAGFDADMDTRTGAARLSIVPEQVNEQLSKRTRAGEALAKRLAADAGLDWDSLSEHSRAARIKNATQSHEQKQKGGKDDVADFASWRQQSRDVGWEPPLSLQLYGPPPPPLTIEQRHRQAYEIALDVVEDKLKTSSVLTHWDLRVAALRGLTRTGLDGLADVDAVTKIMRTEGIRQNGEMTALIWAQEPDKRFVSVTTALHMSEEKEFIQLARSAAADRSGAIPSRLLRQKIAASGLDFTDAHGKAQKAAIERVSTTKFGVIIGAAGMGKTSAVSPLNAAWTELGRDVWGTSLASRQSDDLAGAGIPQHRLRAFDPFMQALQSGEFKLTKNSVLVVDEYGTLGTRQGLELLRQQATHSFTIVALGDDKQCASIAAGPIIDLTRRAVGAKSIPEILTTKRQKDEREQKIVELLRNGMAADALDMKREDGTAEMVNGGRDGVIARTAKLYAERLAATGEAPAISAPTNQDAHDISAAVRLERRTLGLVGPDLRTVPATDGERNYSLPLAAGDRVRLFASTVATYANGRGGPIGRNGSVLDVVAVSDEGLTLCNAKGTVGTVRWDKLMHGGRIHLSYGDAMTIHTAQGSSRGEHISAFPGGTDRVIGQAAYSSLTRHSQKSWLIVSEQAERISVQSRRPINDTRTIGSEDKWANVARSFAHQPEKDSAVSLAARVTKIRQGGVKLFQKTLLPAVQQRTAGQPPSQGPEIVEQRKTMAGHVMDYVHNARRHVLRTIDRAQQTIGHKLPQQSGPGMRI